MTMSKTKRTGDKRLEKGRHGMSWWKLAAGIALSAALLATSAAPAGADNGAQVFRSGLGGRGSVRINGSQLGCLGVSASDSLAQVFVSSGRLVVETSPAGMATVDLHFSLDPLAIYAAPGGDLPHPGDPGFLYSGSTAFAYHARLTSLVPDQFGEVLIPLAIPITMTSPDGAQTRTIDYNETVGIFMSRDQVIAAGAFSTGPYCP